MTHILLSSGERIIIDRDDLESIQKYRWHISTQGYVRTEVFSGGKRKEIKLHNFLLGFIPSKSLVVDHINRNKLDNRKSNLRIVSKKENARNSKTQCNNTSGHRGISFRRKESKWEAYIKVDGKREHLGIFDELADAIKARRKREKELMWNII